MQSMTKVTFAPGVYWNLSLAAVPVRYREYCVEEIVMQKIPGNFNVHLVIQECSAAKNMKHAFHVVWVIPQ